MDSQNEKLDGVRGGEKMHTRATHILYEATRYSSLLTISGFNRFFATPLVNKNFKRCLWYDALGLPPSNTVGTTALTRTLWRWMCLHPIDNRLESENENDTDAKSNNNLGMWYHSIFCSLEVWQRSRWILKWSTRNYIGWPHREHVLLVCAFLTTFHPVLNYIFRIK